MWRFGHCKLLMGNCLFVQCHGMLSPIFVFCSKNEFLTFLFDSLPAFLHPQLRHRRV